VRKVLLILGVVVATVGVLAGAWWGGLQGSDRLWPVTWVVWAPVGAMILWKRPGNGVGRTMLGIGLGWGISFLFLAVAFSSLASLEVRVWAELANTVVGVLPWLGIIWLLLVFPSGKLSRGWHRLAGVGVGLLGAMAVFAFAFTPTPMEATGQPSPLSLRWSSGFSEWFVGEDGFLVVLVVTGLAVLSLAARFRASNGVERHQYRWLLFGAVIFLIITGLGQFLPDENSGMYLWLLGGSAIPLAVGVAVTRYRLFEIDRLLSRTVTYTVVVGVLASLFALVAIGIPNWIPGMSESPLLVAGATLAVAALFSPLRRRMQMAVDRRFNRSRYNAEKVMAAFAGTLREELEVAGIAGGWAQVVSETMEPVSVGIWVRS
jgi:hypothetical protein